MTLKEDPQLICLTCGSNNPPGSTDCQQCIQAARKSSLISVVQLEEPQVCTICGRQDHGIKISEEQHQKHFSRFVEIRAEFLGNFCNNCGSYYCRNEKLPKQSIWTGLKKAICPVCKERVVGDVSLWGELTTKVIVKVKSDLVISVSGSLASEKWINDPYEKQILLAELKEVGPQFIDNVFKELEKKNNLYSAFQLARIAEIGATDILVEQNVEKRLSEMPNFHDIFFIQYEAIFRLEKASRSGILIPRMIGELLDRKNNNGDFRSTLAEKFGEITWDPRVVEGLKMALSDRGGRLAEPTIAGLFTHIPDVGELAAKSLNRIRLGQNNPK